jgi:replication initiation protein RepC
MRHIAMAKTASLGTVQRSELAFLAQALPCTGLINATEAHLLVLLVNTAPKEAFEKNGSPIVFKSNKHLAFELNRSESRVSYLLSRLFDAGVITMQDSGNYKRFPGRGSDGDVSEACGIDLRILVARHEELTELVRTARLEQSARNTALRRYRGTLRMLNGLIEEATLSGITSRSATVRRLHRVLHAVGKPSVATSYVLRKATRLMEWLARRVTVPGAAPEEPRGTPKTIGLRIENNKHIQNTNPYQPVGGNNERRSARADQHNFEKAGSASKRAFEGSLRQRTETRKPKPSERNGLPALQDLLRATPALSMWGIAAKNWTDLIKSIPQMAACADISLDARDRAVQLMGEQAAAVAIAITIQKQETREVTSPGGYLRAMTDRAVTGELYLTRSVYALVARQMSGALN